MLSEQEMREKLRSGQDLRDLIRENLETTLISAGQLDPNGLCNAGCWFCPVKYAGNPEKFVNQLSPSNLEEILQNVRSSSVIAQNRFNFLYTAHYNEVLLYRHFEEMVTSFRRHGFKTMVLSNGTTLTPSKTDVIARHSDVVLDVCLNVPGIEKQDWAAKAGFDERVHKTLLRNLDYYHEKLPVPCKVLVNCVTEQFAGDLKSFGTLTSRARADAIVNKFRERYPLFNVMLVDALTDRSGALADVNVLQNQRALLRPSQKVIGCRHDLVRNNSRLYGWLHVNAKGDVFLCCDDYEMKYTFGNLLERSLDEIWLSEQHVDVIMQSFEELCRRCVHHLV